VRPFFCVTVCAFALAVLGCTETPGYLPPCSDPQVECPSLDGGADGPAEAGKHRDGSPEATEGER
jgi:hypothetical protein